MRLTIKTPSRLHMGLIDLRGDLGRAFGSIGVGIKYPNVILTAEESDRLVVEGEQAERFRSFAERFIEAVNAKIKCRIIVEKTIPMHVGLGSGTQSALAVASLISSINNLRVSVEEAAVLTGRASISSIGIGVFKYGGFIVDAGHKVNPWERSKKEKKSIAPIVFRHPFPKDWLFVVAVTEKERRGLSGEKERKAFDTLPTPRKEWATDICRLVHLNLIPALIEQDIETFGKALTKIQILTGKCFEKIQGGIYASRLAEESCKKMLEAGAKAVGQSSWGPTVYALAQGMKQARKIMLSLEPLLGSEFEKKVFVAEADNRGAKLQKLS
ncbi:MAG: kinase [Thaumarchaeota archaeon]|nr:kinase [Nitrososphaerota archaeon]